MAPSSSSGSSTGSASSSGPTSLFVRTPLPSRRPVRMFPSTKYVAVGVQVVYYGNVTAKYSMAARVTLVDYRGNVIYDSYVRPTQLVCDYRTEVTGLLPSHLAYAPEFQTVQLQVAMLLRDKIIVGHALWQFLSVMGLSHPAIDTRDTALFLPFRKSLKSKSSALIPLATLMHKLMNRQIGACGEVAVEEARAALDLYRSCEQTWEGVVKTGAWPCALPPAYHGNCFT